MTELEKIKAKQAKLEKMQAQLSQRIAELEKVEKPKGYTWEECFNSGGFYIESDSTIEEEIIADLIIENKNLATTEKICLSHLAACQLSHIIERLNKDFGGYDRLSIYYDYLMPQPQFRPVNGVVLAFLPYLTSYEAFNKLVETNTPLLNQYFGIDEER